MKINMKKLFKKMFAVVSISTVVLLCTTQTSNFIREGKAVLINPKNKSEFNSLFEKTGSNPGNIVADNYENQYSNLEEDSLISLKVVLDYSAPAPGNTIEQDVKHFESQNKYYLYLLVSLLDNVLNFSHNRLLPFIWLTFAKEADMKTNFEILDKKDFVSSVSQEKKIESNTEKAYNKPWITDTFTDETMYYAQGLINFKTQKERENEWFNKQDIDFYNRNRIKGSIGILETANGVADTKHDVFKDHDVKVYKNGDQQSISDHATLVAGIAGGKSGVDRFAKIFSAGFQTTNRDWYNKIEWMLIENGVRIINHSYASFWKLNKVEYNNPAFFIDYISRKYGVINVFAAGNGNEEPDKADEWIDASQLSFNSVTVGAVDHYKSFSPKKYSNRLKFGKYIDLPKPLISAPGDYYWLKNVYNSNYVSGTSFATPLVSGAISALMRIKNKFTDENRVSAIKAILAASGKKSYADYFEKEKNRNGLNNSVGAGLLDFEKMLEAADNLRTTNITYLQKGEVFKKEKIKLKRYQEIQVSSAWLFNAGLQKNTDKNKNNNIYEFSSITHKKSTTFKKQNNLFFTDYDLVLEKKVGDNRYQEVSRVFVTASNVELIRYTTQEDGEFRIRILKNSSTTDKDSLDDQLSVTYVKNW